MVGFLPANTLLNTLNEQINFSHTITYTDILGVSYPVSISSSEINSTVLTSGGTISGNYTNVFDETIHYRTIKQDPNDDEFKTVYRLNDIDINNDYEIYHYNASEVRSKTYTYIASANGQSQSYTIVVANDWSAGRDELIKYINSSKYNLITISWTNNTGSTLIWKNNSGTTLNWINLR
jgi:hypothetical protein